MGSSNISGILGEETVINEKDMEENTQNTVDVANAFEFAILSCIATNVLAYVKGEKTKGEAMKNVRDFVSKRTEKFRGEIIEASEKALENADSMVYKDIKPKKKVAYSEIKKRYAEALAKDFRRYIKSKNINLWAMRPDQCIGFFGDEYIQKIVAGDIDYDTASVRICKELGKHGINIVQYNKTLKNKQVRRHVDVWARQSVLYAQRESTRDITMHVAEENGCTIFEFDAHADARPTHQKWQGKRFDTTGKDYPTKRQLNQNQDEDYGCLHRFFPVWNKDDPYSYTQEELDNINTKPFNFEGRMYDGYNAKQKARSLERDIRALKRQKNLLEDQGLNTDEVKQQLRYANNRYSRFMKAYGTYRRSNRTRVIKGT